MTTSIAMVGNGVGSFSDDEIEAPATMTFEELMTSPKPVILSHAEFCKIVMGCAEMYTPHAHPVQPALPLDDPNAETIVSVYRINDLSHQELSREIYCRTIEYLLAGYMVGLKDGFSIVVVSGKQKSIDKYKRLMLKRINWAAVKKSQNTEDEEENKKNEVNKCVLLWEGNAAKPSFINFTAYECKNETEARQVCIDAGIVDYWELAVNYSAD